jgi:hypothetical protein
LNLDWSSEGRSQDGAELLGSRRRGHHQCHSRSCRL